MNTKEMKEVKLNDDESLEELIRSFNFRNFNVGKYIISIDSGFTQWKIQHDEHEIISLVHENHRYNILSKYRKKYDDGFHKEDLTKIGCENLYEILCYIKRHDKRLYTKSFDNGNNVDRLLKNIHRKEA